MSSHKPGAVILVDVPFTDLSQNKKRPALVLLSRRQDHVVVFVTSRIEQTGPGDAVIAASPGNGLAVYSAALVAKLFTLHETLSLSDPSGAWPSLTNLSLAQTGQYSAGRGMLMLAK